MVPTKLRQLHLLRFLNLFKSNDSCFPLPFLVESSTATSGRLSVLLAMLKSLSMPPAREEWPFMHCSLSVVVLCLVCNSTALFKLACWCSQGKK